MELKRRLASPLALIAVLYMAVRWYTSDEFTKPLTGWERVSDDWEARLEYKKPDLWVGLYYSYKEAWLILVPCFPVHFRRRM